MMRHGVKSRRALRHTCGLPDGAIPTDVLDKRKEMLSIDKEAEKHNWIEGSNWVWENRFYDTRHDECGKCGCKRQMMRMHLGNDKYEISPVTYERSNQIFGEDHEPECWGSKNPPKN